MPLKPRKHLEASPGDHSDAASVTSADVVQDRLLSRGADTPDVNFEESAAPAGVDDSEIEEGHVQDEAFGLDDASEDDRVDAASAAQSTVAKMQVDSPNESRSSDPHPKASEQGGESDVEEGEILSEGELSSAKPTRANSHVDTDNEERVHKRARLSEPRPPPASYGLPDHPEQHFQPDLGDFRPVYSHMAQQPGFARGHSPNTAGLPRSRSANAAFYDHYADPYAGYTYQHAPPPQHEYPRPDYGMPGPSRYYDPRVAPLPMPDYSRSDGEPIVENRRRATEGGKQNRGEGGRQRRQGESGDGAHTGKRKKQGGDHRAVPDVPFGRSAETTTEHPQTSKSQPANATYIAPVSTEHTQKALAALPQLPTTVTRLTAFTPGITAAVSGGRIIKTLSYTPSGEQSSEATVKAVYKSLDAGTGQPGILPLSDEDKLSKIAPKLATIFAYHMTPESSVRPQLFAPASDVDLSGVEHLPEPVETTLHGWWPCSNTALLDKDGTMAALAKAAASSGAPLDDRPHIEIFVDNSNILYSFLNWARRRPEAKITTYTNNVNGKTKITKAVTLNNKKVRMDYRMFFGLLERGRKVFKRVLAASSPLWQSLAPAIEWGYEISVLQRVPRPPDSKSKPAAVIAADAQAEATTKRDGSKKRQGREGADGAKKTGEGDEREAKHYKEQGVDEILHLKILETLMDYSPSTNSSKTRPVLVLATGDANSSEYNPTGFLGCVRRALVLGWDVELYAFPEGLSATWAGEEARATLEREQDERKGILRIIDLEVFAEELVTIF